MYIKYHVIRQKVNAIINIYIALTLIELVTWSVTFLYAKFEIKITQFNAILMFLEKKKMKNYYYPLIFYLKTHKIR